jgi:hypothetical protein
MKQEYFDELVDEVSEFIAGREMCSPHFLYDSEIVDYFKQRKYKEDKFYKEKHILKAIDQVR